MNYFATPDWEVNALGDKTCNDLFKDNQIKGLKLNKGKVMKNKKRKELNKKEKATIKKQIQKVGIQEVANSNSVQNKKKRKQREEAVNFEKPKFSNKTEAKNNNIIENQRTKKKIKKSKVKIQNNEPPKLVASVQTPNKKKKNKKNKLDNLHYDNNQNNFSFDESSEKNLLEIKPTNDKKMIKLLKMKEKLQSTNESIVTTKKDLKNLSLREKMMEKLKAAHFRLVNEQIYTNKGGDAMKYFKTTPDAYKVYHEGYRQQVAKWPLNPVDVIIKSIKKLPPNYVIADMGCGDAKLSKSVPQTVHSFDLVANNPTVTACDMSKVPLENATVDVVVFCLSLMGTNLQDYLLEANRILKVGGTLKIAEVESRFDTVDTFIAGVQHFGFKKLWKDLSHNLFYFIDFKKETNIKHKHKLPTVSLHPCLYKKR